MNESISKYFKIGDIVTSPDSVWGKTKFVIKGFNGNSYLPIAITRELYKPDEVQYVCNFDVRKIKLVESERRPFAKTDKPKLIKLMNKGIVEAKREFMIRLNNKRK